MTRLKHKRGLFRTLLLYPFVLNPFFWIAWGFVVLFWIFKSWWKAKGEGNYTVYSIDMSEFKFYGLEILGSLVLVTVNLFWWNKEKSGAYARYITTKFFADYPIGDWRRADQIKRAHYQYRRLKDPAISKYYGTKTK